MLLERLIEKRKDKFRLKKSTKLRPSIKYEEGGVEKSYPAQDCINFFILYEKFMLFFYYQLGVIVMDLETSK